MALVTYILLSTLLAGLRGAFTPELLGSTATLAFIVLCLELLTIKTGTFLLSISSSHTLPCSLPLPLIAVPQSRSSVLHPNPVQEQEQVQKQEQK